jgi:hypothetical protein
MASTKKVKIALTGDRRIDRKLRKLLPAAARKIFRAQMRARLKRTHSVARADAPRGDTGQMRRRIKVRAGNRSRSSINMVVGIYEKDFAELAKAGEWYYPAVEFGLKAENRRPEGTLKKTFRSDGPSARDDVCRGILADLDKEVSK